MKMRNIKGTSDNKCHCDNWIEHWKRFGGGSLPIFCPVFMCIKAPEVGAHVMKEDDVDKNWYIIPICGEHNGSSESLELPASLELAPASISDTCGAK